MFYINLKLKKIIELIAFCYKFEIYLIVFFEACHKGQTAIVIECLIIKTKSK
jgi:hypothetical protein